VVLALMGTFWNQTKQMHHVFAYMVKLPDQNSLFEKSIYKWQFLYTEYKSLNTLSDDII